MYKVMIVDDEYLELEHLKCHINWEMLGFKVSAVAKNGKDAFAKLKSNRPDVLITDIRMPFMDGVDLSKIVHNTYPEIYIIFLTGYNQFEYMKAALQVGAIDYLMKPLEIEELHELMRIVKIRCDENYSHRQSEKAFIADWICREYDNASISSEFRNELKSSFVSCFPGIELFYITFFSINELEYLISIEGNKYFTLSQFQKMLDLLVACVGGILVCIRETKYLLITEKSIETQINTWKQNNQGLQEFITACLYASPIEYEEIPQIMPLMLKYCERLVYHNGPGRVILYEDIPQEYIPTDESCARQNIDQISLKLTEAVQHKQIQDIRDIMDQFYASPKADDLHNQTMNLLDRIYTMSIIPPHVAELYIQRKPTFFNRLLAIESISLLKNIVVWHLTTLALDTDVALQANVHSLPVNKVKEYIEMNYHRTFTIEELGEVVNYSPNYLRNVYKKYTGDTVLETLTSVRMCHAAEFLLSSNLTVRKISLLVGYSNPSYFCAQFFKFYGVSPLWYRNEGAQ